MVFKLTKKITPYPDPKHGIVREGDMPEAHGELLQSSLADLIAEAEEGLRGSLTEVEYKAEQEKMFGLEKDIRALFAAHDICYGTAIQTLLFMVATIHLVMTDEETENEA